MEFVLWVLIVGGLSGGVAYGLVFVFSGCAKRRFGPGRLCLSCLLALGFVWAASRVTVGWMQANSSSDYDFYGALIVTMFCAPAAVGLALVIVLLLAKAK
jgi:hypothetical protein